MSKTGWFKASLLFSLAAGGFHQASADTVVDVSQQWKAHASTVAVPVSASTGTIKTELPSAPEPAGCGCDSLTMPEKLDQCTYAFTGTVSEVGAPKKGRRSIVFDVDEIFKGTPKQDMEVLEDVSGTDCDLPFTEGDSYLIFARWEWGHAVTSRCMGSKRLDKAMHAALGPSEAMKEKLYIQLRNACMGRLDTVCCLSSLKALREGYHVPEPEAGCPTETVPDRLSCAGSYTWCIPMTEKSHRPQ